MKILITIFLLMLSAQAAAIKNYYLLAGFGKSDIDVKREFQVNGENESNDNIDLQLSLGYQFNNNIMVEGGFVSHNSLDIFGLGNHSSVYENLLLVGYRFDITDSISIFPRVGQSWWALKSTEGFLFNPGEEMKRTVKDNDPTYILSVSYNSFYTTYQSTNFGFGSVDSFVMGIKFDF